MLRQNPRKFVYYFCSRHGKIVALQVHLLGRLFIDASDLMSDSYFSVSPTLSAFSLLLSYLCLLRGFICVYKIHLYSLFSKNLRMLIKNPISYFHIGTFLFSGKNVIFWNTGKQKLSCGISLFFTGLSGTVCRGREVFFCGGAWLMKCIYRGIKNNENVRSR